MTRVIGMAFQDRKRPVDLLQQHYACQLVRQGHLAERKYQVRRSPGLVAEPIRRTHCEEEVLRAPILLVAQQLGELFGCKLPPPGIEQDQDRRGAAAPSFRQLQQCSLGGQFMRLCRQISRDPLQILRGQRANRLFLGLADPGDLKFHGSDCKRWAQTAFTKTSARASCSCFSSWSGWRSSCVPYQGFCGTWQSCESPSLPQAFLRKVSSPGLWASAAVRTSTAAPGRKTCAPVPKRCGPRSQRNPTTPTLPGCSPPYCWAEARTVRACAPPRRQSPESAEDWFPSTQRSNR